MFYTDETGAYVVDGDTCYGLSVSAKEKVVEHREIESLTVTRGSECDLPAGAAPATLNEIVARFAITEAHPLVYQDPEDDEDVEMVAAYASSVNPDDHTKPELVAMAEQAGIEVPAKATKADIAALINEA